MALVPRNSGTNIVLCSGAGGVWARSEVLPQILTSSVYQHPTEESVLFMNQMQLGPRVSSDRGPLGLATTPYQHPTEKSILYHESEASWATCLHWPWPSRAGFHPGGAASSSLPCVAGPGDGSTAHPRVTPSTTVHQAWRDSSAACGRLWQLSHLGRLRCLCGFEIMWLFLFPRRKKDNLICM